MPMTVQCPECAAKLKLKDELIGKRVGCPKCSQRFTALADQQGSATMKSAPPSSAAAASANQSRPSGDKLDRRVADGDAVSGVATPADLPDEPDPFGTKTSKLFGIPLVTVSVALVGAGVWMAQMQLVENNASYWVIRATRIFGVLAMIGTGTVATKLVALSQASSNHASRWILHQGLAVIAAAAYAVGGVSYWLHSKPRAELSDAISMHIIPFGIACVGFYVLAMGLMPTSFFAEHRFASQLSKLLGTDNAKQTRLRCLWCGIGFLCVSLLFCWVYDGFNKRAVVDSIQVLACQWLA